METDSGHGAPALTPACYLGMKILCDVLEWVTNVFLHGWPLHPIEKIRRPAVPLEIRNGWGCLLWLFNAF